MNCLLIVQISDIHVGPEFRDDIFHRAVDEINELDPDLLLVTGDLTENGLLSQYEGAAELMKQFNCKHRLYTSGNHDYRSTGYLLFRQFFPSKPMMRTKDLLVLTLGTARPERNDGEAGHRQIVWLENVLRREKRRFKLVMMHHHLVPVPDTGPNTIPILDAGDVLRALDRSGVSLVLCGHRHRPWKWTLNRIPIIHAGSLSSERLRGFFSNSYNIIETNKHQYRAWLKIVNGPKLDFKRIIAGESALASIPFLNRYA
jgi:3',5'-cyclic AMP phosphodiesterase CpdA